MANTGILQATIAYKTSTDGLPLDVDGNLTSVSGKRQAIALLVGRTNPNPSAYEVEYFFNKGGAVAGNPTTMANLDACPVHYIRANVSRIVLDIENPTAEVTIYSSSPWELITGANAVVTPTSGGAGISAVTFTKNDTTGDEWYVFINVESSQTARVRVINVNSRDWILENGLWNNLGFWYNNGIWNF